MSEQRLATENDCYMSKCSSKQHQYSRKLEYFAKSIVQCQIISCTNCTACLSSHSHVAQSPSSAFVVSSWQLCCCSCCSSCHSRTMTSTSVIHLAKLVERRAVPISVALTFAAKRRLHSDSLAALSVGATLAIMSILASPPRQPCSSHVSLLFL